jgi:hypothetical protein
MPHPAVLAAIVVGGVAALGLAIYKELQEQERYQQYQRSYNQNQQQQQQHRNMFRHSNDFELDHDFITEEDKEQDPYILHHDTTQLRSRKPFTNDSSDNENENENSNSEKKSNSVCIFFYLYKQITSIYIT